MRCDHDFESTQRRYMESFAAFDTGSFRRLLHPEALAILPGGGVCRGIEPILLAHAVHFERRVAAYSWNEIHRFVDGCRVAYIVYDTGYTIPPNHITIRALRALTYVHEQGRWLVASDQATVVER